MLSFGQSINWDMTIAEGFRKFIFFSKFAIPNLKLNKTNIFGDVYYGKVASASIKTIYVECTEGTNEMNKNNKLIIYKL